MLVMPQELQIAYAKGGYGAFEQEYDRLPIIYDYITGEFIKVSQEDFDERQRLYDIFPEAAPSGTPGKTKTLPQALEEARVNFEKALKEVSPDLYNRYRAEGLESIEKDLDNLPEEQYRIEQYSIE